MTNSSPWKDPPFFIGKPSISIRAIYTMAAMLVITRGYDQNSDGLSAIIPAEAGFFSGSKKFMAGIPGEKTLLVAMFTMWGPQDS